MNTSSFHPAKWYSFVKRYWLQIIVSFLGWSLVAAIPVTSAYLSAGAPGFAAWWAIFTKIGLYYWLWGMLAPLLYRLTDVLPYQGKSMLLTLLTHLVTAFALSFILGFIVHTQAWHDWLIGERAPGYHAMSFFTYSLIVLCSLAIKFYRLSLLRQKQVTEAKIHAAQLDNQLNLARVDSLRMQMNPHFLFNALNSIAALIELDYRDRAYLAVEQLGDLLRQSISMSQNDEIPLSREIQFCKAYLSMEQIRFNDRLQVEWKLDEQAMDLLVPAFVLQPFIENTIKHAVINSTNLVTVTIQAGLESEQLVLSVKDDGHGQGINQNSTATGLSNLNERLRLRYGSGVSVESHTLSPGFDANIRIPLKILATESDKK